jgi:hypothetical protein
MAKKLLVRKPVTRNGITLVYDDEKQPVFTESIVELSAKRIFESINASLPTHLRYELKEVDVTEVVAGGSSNDELKKKLEDLEAADEKKRLLARIAELEAAQNPSTDTSLIGDPEKATVVIANITEEKTKEQVKNLLGSDERKTVKDAAAKRIAELEVAIN